MDPYRHNPTKIVNKVTFHCPGTFFNETETRPIDSWDVEMAVKMSQEILARYNARPFAFSFSEWVEHEDVDDSMGGKMKVEPKQLRHSGMYYLNGFVKTFDDIKAENNDKNEILLSNMEGNEWPLVIETRNGFRHTATFKGEDFNVNVDTMQVVSGNESAYAIYRETKIAEWKQKWNVTETNYSDKK